jgi:hypothetical protein
VEVGEDAGKTALPDMKDGQFQQLAIDAKDVKLQASPNSSVQRTVAMLIGVTGSEFSSRYQVRGGNYDENLIYMNGVQFYRPQLVRAGRQEGLPITNSDLLKNVSYSAGGFQARYGDKMSSVLKMDFREPTEFQGSAEAGLIRQTAHIEGSFPTQKRRNAYKDSSAEAGKLGRLTYLIGARRFSMSYVLNSLDTQGEYQPLSWDVQSVFTYTPPTPDRPQMKEQVRADGSIDTVYLPQEPLKITVMNMITGNDYRFEPASRETTFGTIQQAVRLFVGFTGTEQTSYLTNQTALVVDHQPSLRLDLKYIGSHFRSDEDELINVEGGYRLGDVNTSLGNESFNEVVFVRGIGTRLHRARNYMTFNVSYGAVRGEWKMDRDLYDTRGDNLVNHRLFFGLRGQHERIFSQFKEWRANDSAQFVDITRLVESEDELESQRAMGYLQYNWRINEQFGFNIGGRAHYWTLNDQLVFSPRSQVTWEPALQRPEQSLQVRLAAGVYNQPPFFRELRNYDGRINRNQKAQRAIHYVAGVDYVFELWDRPFKLFAEAYYKDLDNLVPYEIDNVRLRYYAFEQARGRAYGLDTKLNGQFIQGVDSWVRVSLMKAEEKIAGLDQGYVPRPTDQRLTTSLFFQDHIPGLKTFKAHVNMIYGTGLPDGPPLVLENRTGIRRPFYHRVDLGVSYLLTFQTPEEQKAGFGFRSIWLSLEVFNVFQRANTISYEWITDTYGNRFAIPNFLSQRLINGRVIVKF